MNDWRELKIMVKALADVARLTIVYHLAHRRQVHCSMDRSRYHYCLQRLETLIDPSVQLELLLSGEALIEAEAALEE